MVFIIEYYHNFKESLILILLNFFCTIKVVEIFPNYFYEATVTLICKPHRHY